jgi:O-antigen/teichoic acid export membrane protein
MTAGAALSIRSNAAWTLAGTLVYAASQWIIAIVFARFGGAEAVGLFAFASALAMPIILASQLALRQFIVTDVRQRYAFADYFRLRLGGTVVAFLLIATISIKLGYTGSELSAIIAIGAGRCLESISDIHYGRMQRDQRLDHVARYTAARGLLCVIVVPAAFVASGSMVVAGIAFALACGVSAFLVDRVREDEADARQGRWIWRYSMSLAFAAAPLAIAQVLSNLTGTMPRFVLQGTGGTALVGQFAVVEYFIIATHLAAQSLGQAAAPRLARLAADNAVGEFVRLSRNLVVAFSAVGLALFLVAFSVGAELMTQLYGRGFEEAGLAFAALAASAVVALVASALNYVATATGRFKQMPLLYACGLAVALVMMLALVPSYGLVGIAIASASGYATLVAGLLIVLQRNGFALWR